MADGSPQSVLDNSAIDAAQLIDPNQLAIDLGASGSTLPGLGGPPPASPFAQPGSGAASYAPSVADYFRQVPVWVWAIVGGVVLLKVIR